MHRAWLQHIFRSACIWHSLTSCTSKPVSIFWEKEQANSISHLWIKHPWQHNELHVFRMRLRWRKASLKWCALCLLNTVLCVYSLEVKQSCKNVWNICIFVLSRFIGPTLKAVMAYFYCNISLSHIFAVKVTFRHKQTRTPNISCNWQHRGYESEHWGKCAYVFSLLRGIKSGWWKVGCVPVGGHSTTSAQPQLTKWLARGATI